VIFVVATCETNKVMCVHDSSASLQYLIAASCGLSLLQCVTFMQLYILQSYLLFNFISSSHIDGLA